MNTDDLIAMLATDSPAVDRAAPSHRFATALLIGIAGAGVLMTVGLGIRPDFAEAARTAMFWLRMIFAMAMAGGALLLMTRLSRPGVRVRHAWTSLATPVVLVWVLAGIALMQAPDDTRVALVLGQTWRVCPLLIGMLSVPGLLANLWAVRGMAPVRPGWAGAAAGLLAGATATMAYCMHCPEMAPPFWAVWYVSGMLLPAAVGALLGARVLRW